MAEVRFRVLGALEVVGEERSVPSGRQRVVLARLLVDAGRPVTADELIDAAWRSDPPQEPHRALRTVLSRLRAVVGHDVLETGPAGYRLAVAPGDVDSAAFEQLVARSRTAGLPQARDLLARALGLWRGPAYDDLADAPFATDAAQRLDRARADAVEAYAGVLIRTDEPGAGVVELERLLAGDPFRERAVELLARARYHAGRQTEALAGLRSYRVMLADELGLDPSPGLVALEGDILGHALAPGPVSRSTPPRWLDTSTAFIGREDERADVVAAVATTALTVVTGPGGVGKSRLAAEALGPIGERLGLPMAVAELGSVPPGRSLAAVADALGLRPEAEALDDDLVEYLARVPHVLVLDGCERLIDELAPLVDTIVRRCRDGRVLATSRRRLGSASELVVPLGPLGLPHPEAAPGLQGSAAAVRLFTDRVRRLRPTFALTPDGTGQVAELCRWCDGLPLALELAASRTATSGVAEVLDQLSAEPADVDRGLHAVVDWSVRLLEPDQRSLLEYLSVFAGTFDGDGVRRMTRHLPSWCDEVSWRDEASPALAELVESSLVAQQLSGTSSRYRLLEMVRAYAVHQLAASGRADDARRAHAQWVRETVASIRADWARTDGAVVGERLTTHSAEVARALRWALGAEELELAADISHAVGRCWHWTPGLDLGDLMLEVGERCAVDGGARLAPAVGVAAFLAAERGDLDRGRAMAGAALAGAEETDSTVMAGLAMAVCAMYSGDLDTSARWFRELAALPGLAGEGNTSLALIACYRDDLEAARTHVRVALAAGPVAGDASYAFARYAAGEVEARTDPSAAAVLLSEAAAEAERVGAEQVGRVARVALFALLVRGDRPQDAAALGLPLVGDLHRRGAWNQAWTMMRLLAELLAGAGRWPDAMLLLAAAGASSSAPPPVGDDVPRYASLETELERHLSRAVAEQIRIVAAGTPRGEVLGRAERVLAELAGVAG